MARRALFAFAGQGAQGRGMGDLFLRRGGQFSVALGECAEAWRKDGTKRPVDLRAGLADATEEELSDTTVAQPLIVALQISASRAVADAGFVPVCAVGHSLGDVTAAHIAGHLSLAEALAVVRHRSEVMAECIGSMAACRAPAGRVRQALRDAGLAEEVYVAGCNAKDDTTISGAAEVVKEATSVLKRSRIVSRLVPVRYAFHSPLLTEAHEEALRGRLQAVLGDKLVRQG
eukprot:Hpha_TRINITY_DN4460_c0_g1::TRINITY_DN4460_c0_g1_i1::g.50504::m.50504